MKKLLSLALLLVCLCANARPIRINFNDPATLSDTDLSRHSLISDPQRGTVLSLTPAAGFRQPIPLPSAPEGPYTVIVWAKTTPGAEQGGNSISIATNIDKEAKTGGFTIGAASNGSWFAGLSDGRSTNWYEPTRMRQPLNDGEWHMLAIAYDPAIAKARFYYDGQNVAIYNMSEYGSALTDKPILLGGADTTEWNAFNGLIGSFDCYDRILAPDELTELYIAHNKQARRPSLPGHTAELGIIGFNIWHGGNETGSVAGPERVADVIADSGADIAGVIETYGSGAKIADRLGWYLYLHSSNLSIMSRYPIEDTPDFFQPFNCSAATIRISQTQTINYINLWLHYLPSTDSQIRDRVSVDSILRGEWQTRAGELQKILKEAETAGFITGEVPTFVSGDFNMDSHLDWSEAAKELHSGYVIPWPTSLLMYEAGFRDSFRELHTDPATRPGITWSPVFKDELQYRIDFIYYKGAGIRVRESRTIEEHPVRYPSDHAAIFTRFGL